MIEKETKQLGIRLANLCEGIQYKYRAFLVEQLRCQNSYQLFPWTFSNIDVTRS